MISSTNTLIISTRINPTKAASKNATIWGSNFIITIIYYQKSTQCQGVKNYPRKERRGNPIRRVFSAHWSDGTWFLRCGFSSQECHANAGCGSCRNPYPHQSRGITLLRPPVTWPLFLGEGLLASEGSPATSVAQSIWLSIFVSLINRLSAVLAST